jgi:hypothetical protein
MRDIFLCKRSTGHDVNCDRRRAAAATRQTAGKGTDLMKKLAATPAPATVE